MRTLATWPLIGALFPAALMGVSDAWNPDFDPDNEACTP